MLGSPQLRGFWQERQGRKRSSNTRNGHGRKVVQTESGPLEIQVPRDREGTFEPQLVKKQQRRLEGFDEKVIALYARGGVPSSAAFGRGHSGARHDETVVLRAYSLDRATNPRRKWIRRRDRNRAQ